jgi:hypothetical protein
MVTAESAEVSAEMNQAASGHPKWSHISVYRPKPAEKKGSSPNHPVPDLAVAPVPNDDMIAMLNGGGAQKGIAIALGAVPYVFRFITIYLVHSS